LPAICGSPTDRADPGAARWLRGVEIDLAQPDASAHRCSEVIDNFGMSRCERAEMSSYALHHYNWRDTARRVIALAQDARINEAA
jgi:hypothetical protein